MTTNSKITAYPGIIQNGGGGSGYGCVTSSVTGNMIDTGYTISARNYNASGVSTESSSITITDEEGLLLNLSIAEVSRLYTDAQEHRRVLRFSRIFSEVKDTYKELLTLIKLMDPLSEDELIAMEEDIKADNSSINGSK